MSYFVALLPQVSSYKHRILLMFQIGTLMGIGWMFGFLASAVDVQILWWLFVVINSLHGPLLLASVFCSTQFKQLLSETSKNNEDIKKQNTPPCVNKHRRILGP